jgi:hypothetical protein
MKRVADLCRRLSPKVVGVALVLGGATFAIPAQAQTSQLDLFGYVAPRCWVSSGSTLPNTDGAVLPPRAICNQSAPRLESRMRTLNADGTLTTQMIPVALTTQDAPQEPSRAALEIVVTPQL